MIPERLSDFLPLVAQSLGQPRVTLRKILAINAPREHVVLAGWVVVAIGMFVSQLLVVLLRDPALVPPQIPMVISSAVVGIVSVFGGGYLMHRIGAAFGGLGDLNDSLRTVIWMNFVIMFVQIPIPIAIYLGADTINPVSIVAVIFTLIQVVSMTRELHGFTNSFYVLLAVLGVQFSLGIFSLIVFQMLGLPLEPNSTTG